jgi:polyphosphate kinase
MSTLRRFDREPDLPEPAKPPRWARVPSIPEPPPSPVGVNPDQRLLNRDLSWLEFNRRVLAQSTDPRTPLLNRVKFLAIFSSNLDEFFMKRVGYFKRQVEQGITTPTPDGLTPRQLLFAIRSVVLGLRAEQARCWNEDVRPALREAGVHILKYAELDEGERKAVDRWYMANVFPILTPLAVDPGHRFPFISNLSESLGVTVSQPGEPDRHFARVKIPDVLPRLLTLSPAPGEGITRGPLSAPPTPEQPARFLPLDELIRNNLDDLFPGMQIHDVAPFRVTRNAAIVVEGDDGEDLLQTVENELKLRRFARAVALEVTAEASPAVVEFITRALRLEPDDVYVLGGPLEYADLWPIVDLPLPDRLRESRWSPVVPARLADPGTDIFAAIRERDILLHHPYESFHDSVERFIAAAARDPDVLAIKQTIYRTSRDSPFIASLVRAAEEGKQVAVLVELRARFDEQKNVRFARQLEKAGVHVAYGVVGYKTHCKISLVVRREAEGLRSYAHLGTGNYNPSTAQLYTDLGLLTCDRGITEDAVGLFNFLTGRSLKKEYAHLIVAPFQMRRAFMGLIDREIANAVAGRPARIVAKMNSLEDLKITDKLYEASQAGVNVLLIVRGFCCLRPGVPGMSENIRVMSVVGRFLEHSRLYHFAGGEADPLKGDWYISSADWMYRNLTARVETACPVNDPDARRRLSRLVEIMLGDRRVSWDLGSDGRWVRRVPRPEADPESPEVLGTFRALMRETSQSM